MLSLPSACAHTSERIVEYGYQGTKDEVFRRSTLSGTRAGVSEVPAFYLVATDQSVCEVDSAQFAKTHPGTSAHCLWASP